MHTPGHTPEHLSFLVTDTAAADQPMGAFTGDFVFVGDVGRPDLLEKAAAGRRLRWIRRARPVPHACSASAACPTGCQLWPGARRRQRVRQGARRGAAEHARLRAALQLAAFQTQDEDEFVATVLAGQPEPPRYFAQMKRHQPRRPARPRRLRASPHGWRMAGWARLLATGAPVLDTRATADFAAGHVPGHPERAARPRLQHLGRLAAAIRCGLLPDRRRRAGGRGRARPGVHRPRSRGGHLLALRGPVLDARRQPLDTIPTIGAAELRARMDAGKVDVLDVRGLTEWQEGHLPGVPNVPVGFLADRLGQVPTGRPLFSSARAAPAPPSPRACCAPWACAT